MLHTIKKVEYLEEYKLKLTFNDKSVKIVDLGNMIKNAKNMFIPLQDPSYFKKVKCDGITICWPNGVDLCPDVLYEMGKNTRPISFKRHPRRTIKKQRKPTIKRSRRARSKV